MADVIVAPLNILGGTQLAGVFQDTFQRANSPNWGQNWADWNFTQSSSGVQATATINANTALQAGAAGNTVTKILLPLPLMWMATQATPRNQFAECTFGTIVNNGAFGVGPLINASPTVGDPAFNFPTNGQGFYFLQWNGTNIQIFRYLYNGNTSTGANALSLSTIVATIASGDVLRLEGTFNSGTSTWTLTAKKNGTVIGTTTDNVVTIAGEPGAFYSINSGASATTIVQTEFAGGLL